MRSIRQWWRGRIANFEREPGEGELAVMNAGRKTTGVAWSRIVFIGRDETFGHLIVTGSHLLYRTKDNAKLRSRDVERVGDVDIALEDISSVHVPRRWLSVKSTPVPPLTNLDVRTKDGHQYSFFLVPVTQLDGALSALDPSHRLRAMIV